MKCPNCNNDIKEGEIFCSKCGTKIVVIEDIKPEPIEDEESSNTYIKMSPPKSNKLNLYLAGLKERKAPLKLVPILGIYALILIFLCGSFTFKLSSNKDITILTNSQGLKTGDNTKKHTLKEVHISDDEYTVMPGQIVPIDYYVYPEESDISGLIWKSSNPNIKVNQSGYVTSASPNEAGVITISNLDGTIKDQCKLRVLTKEEAFFNTMDYINNHGMEEQKQVNFGVEKFTPKTRTSIDNQKLALKVFETVNTNISSYQLTQKQFTNAQTKNPIDCDIYTDLNTGDIKKIVTIEYLENNLEITDYYYTDGNVYFTFKRNENYYRPIPAQQDFPGSRYYFYKDSLLKWREIEKTTNNIFEKTDYSYNKDFEWKKYAYRTLDDDVNKEKSNYVKANENLELKKQTENDFLKREKDMLNAAYIIYNKAVEAPKFTSVTGYVLNSSGQPMSEVSVKIFSEKYGILIGETRTNSEGLYKITVPIDDSTYTAYISSQGYIGTNIYEINPSLGTSSLFQENVYMYSASNMLYNIKINLINALNGSTFRIDEVQGTYVVIRKGINNKKGAIEGSFQLYDAYNPIYYIQLLPGNYTAEVISPGRESSYFTISTLQDNMEVYSNIVPKITDDSVRVVLSWGENPRDLDSHLFLPGNNHISYYSPQASGGYLDVDDTSSYGPETITLNSLKQGTYKYYVADFTNCSGGNYSSKDMSNSFARVDVYTKNGLTATFAVPHNRQGVIWQVFDISNGKIVPIQRCFNNIQDMEWWTSNK